MKTALLALALSLTAVGSRADPAVETAEHSATLDVAALLKEQRALAKRVAIEDLKAVQSGRAGILIDMRNSAALLATHVAAFRRCQHLLISALPPEDDRLVAAVAPPPPAETDPAGLFTSRVRQEAPPEFRECQTRLSALRLYAGILRNGQSRLRELDAKAAAIERILSPAAAGNDR